MKLIFLYGPPGVGKLTIAQDLAKLTGYKLFHNHLTVDLVYSLFDFKTKPFIELRDSIWMSSLQKAKKEKLEGIIFTFAPEESVPDYFIPEVIKLVEDGTGEIYFVELICTPGELKKRIVNPSRSRYSKGMNPENIEKYYSRHHLIPEIVHKRKFLIDTTDREPATVAGMIVKHFSLGNSS